jgi:ribokinase
MSAPRLVCYGNLTIDDLVLPDGSEVPGLCGGDALYAALGARLFEPRTEMVAPVGMDLPEATRRQIEAAGLSRDGMAERPLPTLRNRVVYRADGSRAWTLMGSEDDFHRLSPAPSDVPARFRDAEAHLVLAMTLAAQEALVDWLRAETSGVVALDLQEDYIAGNEARLLDLIGKVDFVLPSGEEAARLLGHRDWSRAARELAALGPRIVVVKLGATGSLVYDAPRGREIAVPAFPAGEVDPTGAGDSFCGAFLAALLDTPDDAEGAARAGAVAASFAIADYGTAGAFRVSGAEARRRLAAWLAVA